MLAGPLTSAPLEVTAARCSSAPWSGSIWTAPDARWDSIPRHGPGETCCNSASTAGAAERCDPASGVRALQPTLDTEQTDAINAASGKGVTIHRISVFRNGFFRVARLVPLCGACVIGAIVRAAPACHRKFAANGPRRHAAAMPVVIERATVFHPSLRPERTAFALFCDQTAHAAHPAQEVCVDFCL